MNSPAFLTGNPQIIASSEEPFSEDQRRRYRFLRDKFIRRSSATLKKSIISFILIRIRAEKVAIRKSARKRSPYSLYSKQPTLAQP